MSGSVGKGEDETGQRPRMRKRVTEWRLCTNTKDITHSALGDTCWQSEECESVHAGRSMYTVSHGLRRLEGNTATSLKHQNKCLARKHVSF